MKEIIQLGVKRMCEVTKCTYATIFQFSLWVNYIIYEKKTNMVSLFKIKVDKTSRIAQQYLSLAEKARSLKMC